MNARKVLFVLGGLVCALVAAVIAVSLFTIQKMEREKNAAKTKPARDKRWARTQETETSDLRITPDGIENPNTEGNADTQTEDKQPD